MLARHALQAPQRPSAFQANVQQVGGLLLRVVLMMVPAVFVLNYLSKGDALQAAAGVIALAMWLPTGALAPELAFQPLPLSFWGFVAALVLSYLLGAQWLKTAFIRRHGWT